MTTRGGSVADEASVETSRGRLLRWGFLGRVGWQRAYELQEKLRRELKAGQGAEHLLLLEHDPVYTLGRNADPADIVADRQALARAGVEVFETNRGGQVTYHGPGQLVGYPILDLNPDRRDVRRYVRDLQDALVRTLAELGIEAQRRDEQSAIGVWVGQRKIASVGVHLSRWVTAHGFALNVSTDLSYFGGIVACGIAGLETTSVAQLTGKQPALGEVAARVAFHLGEILERRLEPADRSLLAV